MKRILVPCDFSVNAKNAYTFALDIAKRNNAEVFVLHVIDFPVMYDYEMPMALSPELWKEWESEVARQFKALKQEHARQSDITFRILSGPVSMSILNFIKAEKIDLVVMGTKGTSGFVQEMIGSNTEKIVRFAEVPVFAIRRAVNLSSIKNIVVPTTLAMDQTEFISHVKALQEFFDADLHLLVVDTPHNMQRSADQYRGFENYIRHYNLKKCTMTIRNGFREEDEIMSFAKEKPADMIAMATHGRRGLAHIFKGSVTEDVVNHVDCPVWTFPLRSNPVHFASNTERPLEATA